MDAIKSNPVVGVGPNRFVNQWLLSKPVGINETVFWNVDFKSGVGLIPTFMVTTGVLGILAFVLFLASIVYAGVRALFLKPVEDITSRLMLLITFLGVIYLWIFAIVYVPDNVVFALAFLFTGLFVGALVEAGATKNFNFHIGKSPRFGFLSILAVVLLIIASLATLFGVTKKAIAMQYFQNGLTAVTVSGDIDKASRLISSAIWLDGQDYYYRTLSQVNVLKMRQVVSQQGVAPEVLRQQFQTISGEAITNAREATKIDDTQYGNWVSLGDVYSELVPIGVGGAYELALQSYDKSLSLNPTNAMVFLNVARLEIAKGDKEKAKGFIGQALQRKSNYAEALFMLAQIQAQEGKVKDAIKTTEQATLVAPQDVGLFFQLGLLKYMSQDYKGAVVSLEKAVSIVPSYSNARYFLGLSYAKVGKKAEAIAQFKEIEKLNPDNTEVKTILRNLGAGVDPLQTISPPAQPPEKRSDLPVKDTN
jgi:tetratricopeptide (TPR) repeat protein